MLTGKFCVLTLVIPTLVIGTTLSADETPHQHGDQKHGEQKPDSHKHGEHHHAIPALKFSIVSAKDGDWSNPHTWVPARVPKTGDRVLIRRGAKVRYDVANQEVIRLLQVVGELRFATNRNTELNVGVLKVQDTEECAETGFACEFRGEPTSHHTESSHHPPALLIGTPEHPVPAKFSARVRLHHLEGMDANDAPALACCGGRMEIHGSPLNRTWVKLAANAKPGENYVVTTGEMSDWKIGDEVIITATERGESGGSFRDDKTPQTEKRVITAVAGTKITLNEPLENSHAGEGNFRGEVANLSRNVIVESAKPDGVRGHTVYHRYSSGGISYAKFAHLGKEGVLGRYAIHYHLVGQTMRGSAVQGVAIVDSHNRWVTIHGTQYLIVRDCIGYQSVGHGYFLEDGTEVYNLLDRNLAVQAYSGRRLPGQVLSFDPNDGAGFWWANGRNTITRNVTAENDEYGYRYDMQKRSNFDSNLPILHTDGKKRTVDVRTIPIWRFDNNEAHAEGFYGMVVAANGNSQPDSAIQNEKSLANIKRVDWTGPDVRHPHRISNLAIWGAHYALRPHSPAMKFDNIRIHNAVYGIYRPAFENHEYTNLHISQVAAEPFNRGMDDASAQTGKITVDGLTFESGYGNKSTPLVQISDLNLSGDAATHFRNVKVNRPERYADRWPLINRGVGPRVTPLTSGVPIYLHDHFGSGRHAKVVSSAAKDLLSDGNEYRQEPPLTGNEAMLAEVTDVDWPKLLDPVDDEAPATIITQVETQSDKLTVSGVSHDNGIIVKVIVNGREAKRTADQPGVTDWEVSIPKPKDGKVSAFAIDDADNREVNIHVR